MKNLLLPLLLLAQSAFAADGALLQCRQIEDLEERVTCYDTVVDSHYAVDRIEANVTDIRESAGKKLTVTLDNGQVWRQLDNKTLRLEIGEAVIVRKASLGSFLMEKETGSRSVRVKRLN